MDKFGDYLAAKREMAEALRALIASGTVSSPRTRAEMSTAVMSMMKAGASDGTQRGDVSADDVVASIVGIFLACRRPDQRDHAGRMLDLLMDGQRAQ
jgi:hypothetical protein